MADRPRRSTKTTGTHAPTAHPRMTQYGPSTYGDRIAGVYDRYIPSAVTDATEAAVNFLADLAPGARALELGIGTGRVAIPLAERGLSIHGVDASQPMVDRLRAKEGGSAIPVVIDDFASVTVDGQFDLVYVVFNTLFALLSQED